MPRGYKKLSLTERLKIEALLKAKVRPAEIAKQLGRNKSTVYREIRRGRFEKLNSDLTTSVVYAADVAQKAVDDRYRAIERDLKIGHDREYAEYLETQIIEGKKSPEAVLGEIKAKAIPFNTTISLRTFYNYIANGVFLRLTNKDLPFKGKRRKRAYNKVRKAKRAPKGESIEKRPLEIDTRKTFGHWECDTVVGERTKSKKKSKNSGKAKMSKNVLLVLTERKTREEIIEPLPDKSAASTVAAFNRIERKYGDLFPKMFKTITVDNGTEFSDCDGMEQSCLNDEKRTKFFYCHAYSAYERGSNENQNRMIRRFYPKGTSFDSVSPEEIKALEEWINNYPRRSLNFKCAHDLFAEEMRKLISP